MPQQTEETVSSLPNVTITEFLYVPGSSMTRWHQRTPQLGLTSFPAQFNSTHTWGCSIQVRTISLWNLKHWKGANIFHSCKFSVWDTSGSTNFDSVRPLSYSEVGTIIWRIFFMLISRITSRSWHSFNAVIAFIQKTCRRTSSLCASALPSLSPFTMSEVTGLSR